MKEFSIEALARIIKAQFDTRYSILDTRIYQPLSIEHPASSIEKFFTNVSIDSRTTKAGDCFFAIPGENFDGHDYICDAFEKGAVCAVVSKDVSSCEENTQYAIRNTQYVILRVNDTVKALGDFAAEYRRQCGFKVVAITGSVGKTMTRQIAYHVLSQHFRVFASPKNFNNQIGLPLTLLGANPDHEIVIAELGTNHPGEIAYLTHIAQPDIAVVTNVYPAHLEGFGKLQAVAKEKLSIAEGLLKEGVLIINADIVSRVTGHVHRVITFGKSDGSDYQIRDITYNGDSSSFTIDCPSSMGKNRKSPQDALRRKIENLHSTPYDGKSRRVYLPVPGPGNVENALAAWAVCSQFGLTIDDFARAVKTLQTLAMRAELLQIGTLTVLNDCYNANPASMKNALDILTNLDPTRKRRLVFICGDMAELGQYAQSLHTELGDSIAQAKVQVLLAIGKFARITAEAAKRTADYNLQTICFDDTLSACNNLQKFVKDYDIILVKGSRAARLEIIIEKLKELFSYEERPHAERGAK